MTQIVTTSAKAVWTDAARECVSLAATAPREKLLAAIKTYFADIPGRASDWDEVKSTFESGTDAELRGEFVNAKAGVVYEAWNLDLVFQATKGHTAGCVDRLLTALR